MEAIKLTVPSGPVAEADGKHLALRDDFRAAKLVRAKHRPETLVVLDNCRVLDVKKGQYKLNCLVVVHEGKIVAVQECVQRQECNSAAVLPLLTAELQLRVARTYKHVVWVDCNNKVLMPGLCDAHVHCTACTANLSALQSLSESYVAARAGEVLQGMLMRGFTTVRDAGGADWGLAQAVDEGIILGPRVLFTGHALSQTGGHGDFRGKGEDFCACGAALRGIGRVCDGDAEVRRAARDELRRGAHCIKIMASGGVASPTDRLTNTQFSREELTAIVEEAEAAGTYVCAHAYMPSAIKRAVQCGVRSIEHGNFLDKECAQLMAQRNTFLVPTTVTYQQLQVAGEAAGMPKELVSKVGNCVEEGLRAMQLAKEHGVTMCFGSDLLGDMHPQQSQEFPLRAQVLPALDVLQAATLNCAALFGLQYQIGEVNVGWDADLVLVDGDPLQDVSVLAKEAAIRLVMKAGLFGKVPNEVGWSTVNAHLMNSPGTV